MRIKLLAIATSAALLSLIPVSADANHSWGGYHWARTSNPFTIKLGDNVNTAWDASLAQASSDWSQSDVLDTLVIPGTANPRTCKATKGMVQVCNASYGNNGWLGIASISVTGGTHITQGTVKLNDTYFNTATYNTPAWRALVTCQEIGHTFGLDHQDEVFDNPNLGTCMDYTNNPAGPPSNTQPNAHDYGELDSIYAHLDSTTTIGASAIKQHPQVGNDQASWGRLISGSRASGHATYVRDFAGGDSVITFVTWAS